MLTAALPLAPPHSAATDRRVLLAARRLIRDRISLLFGQALFQAAYDLAGAPQRESNRVPEDFSLRHARIEHKENKRASRYILWGTLQARTIRLHASVSERKEQFERAAGA